jgi:hypothetical protein
MYIHAELQLAPSIQPDNIKLRSNIDTSLFGVVTFLPVNTAANHKQYRR